MTAAAAAVTLAVFAVTLNSATFINAPDSVLRLPLVSHGKHVAEIFTRDFMVFTDGQYRPLSYALIALVRTVVSADNVIFWHLWLAAFHVLNALLVWGVARHFTRNASAAVIALAVFLLHPAASAFAGQMNLFHHVLGAGFTLGAFLCYLRHAETRKVAAYLLALVLFACGLLTSHVVLTLPILILVSELFFRRAGILAIVGRLVPFAAVAALAGGCFLTLRPHPLFYVYPKRINVGALRYWTYSFAGIGVDTFLALARGLSTRAPFSGLVGNIDGTWRLIGVAGVLGTCLAVSLWGLLRKQWFAVGLFLLLLGMLPRFGSAEIRTPDGASWSTGCLPLAGFALLAGALADSLLALGARLVRRCVLAAAVLGVTVLAVLLVRANLHARTPEGYWQAALRENPRSELAAVALGKAYLAAGSEEEALRYLFHPTVGSVRESCLAMARYYSRKGAVLAAAVHLEIVQREDAPGLQFQEDKLTVAEVMEAAGATDFAEQELGWVVMADPHNTVGLKRLAEIQAEKGYLPAAVKSLQTVADIDPWDAANASRLKALKERFYNPESYITPAHMTPPDPDWLRYASNQGNSRKITQAVIQMADSLPRDPIIQLSAGILLSADGKHPEALKRIDRTIASLPSWAYARATRCWVVASAGDSTGFVETLRRMGPLKPRDADIWYYLSYLLTQTGRDDLARIALETTLKADPHLAGVHNDLAALLVRRGEYAEALVHYRRALALATDRNELVQSGLGYVLRQLGRPDEAIVHFREAIAIDPKSPTPYRNLAMISERKGRFDEGVRTLEEGLQHAPDDTGLRSDLAKLLATAPDAKLRDGERAVRLAEGACRDAAMVTPQMLDVLAAAYAETGRFDSAVVTARQAAALARSQRDPTLARGIEERMRLYQLHQPIRIPGPPVPPR